MSPRSLLGASSIRDMKPGDSIANEREEAAKRFNLSFLPGQVGETVRIIRIGDYDACPCIGEHDRRTKEGGGLPDIPDGLRRGRVEGTAQTP